MNIIICHAICVCSLFATCVIGDIIQKPLNVATGVGGQNVFNCSSSIASGAIQWLSSTDCNIATGVPLTVSNCDLNNSYAANYRIEKPNGFTCNLIVYDAVISLGGCYICSDGIGIGRTASAFLIIVDSDANITPNITDTRGLIPGEDVMITSTVSYRGPTIPSQPPQLLPSFYWTSESDPNQNITSHQGLTTNTSASSYIFVTAQKPIVPPYICNLFFNAPTNFPSGCADNAPTYQTSWKTPTFDVSYPPESMNISEVNDGCPYNVPVVLTCSASGHPIPTYQWLDLTHGVDLPRGSIVSIDYPGTYECEATNTIRDALHTESMYVNVSNCFGYVPVPSSTCDIACIIILVIVIYFGLNLLFFVIFMICYGSKNGRIQLNDRFPWLEDMLPCMNNKGCECSVSVFYFVLLSIFVGFVFFPTILIMASCCKKKTKTSPGRNLVDIHMRQAVYVNENVLTPNNFPEAASYESLQQPASQSTATLYQELTQRPQTSSHNEDAYTDLSHIDQQIH